MNIALFFETNFGKYIKNLVIGLGASVVLIGALFKIQHLPGANEMLFVGMITEAIIFAMLGILPPHSDYYWEKFYPGITENPHVEALKKGAKHGKAGAHGGPTGGNVAAMDKMLEDAKINQDSLKKLSESFTKFGQTVDQIKDVSKVAASTDAYSKSAQDAADSLTAMKATFVAATQSMSSFNNASADTVKYHEQVEVLTKNLGVLNGIYEIELQDANNHLKAMNKFYSSLANASESMAMSAKDANSAKEQIALLSKNLTTLNQVYGNMLSAMQVKG